MIGKQMGPEALENFVNNILLGSDISRGLEELEIPDIPGSALMVMSEKMV